MLKPKLVALAVASVTALAAAPSAHAATDYFMRLDSVPTDKAIVKGETQDAQYKDYIELKSFSWSAENPTTIGSQTGGAGAGKAMLNQLTVEKDVDGTTPLLFQHLAQGQRFAGVEIVARKAGSAGGVPVKPLRYYFTTAFVTSQEQTGDAGDDVPREKLTIAYGAVSQKVFRSTPSAPAPAPVFGQWNQVTNAFAIDKQPSDWQ